MALSNPSNIVPVTFLWTDPEGKRTTMKRNLYVGDLALCTPADLLAKALALGTLIQATTHANLTRFSLGIFSGSTYTLPTETGTFDSIEDKAQLTYVSPHGNKTELIIPAPVSTIFLAADGETVDPANASVSALLTELQSGDTGSAGAGGAVINWATGQDVAAPNVYISGERLRKATRKRFRPGIAAERGGD